MIFASTMIALPLLAVALMARRFRSDLEERAWRLMALVMLAAPLFAFLPKFDLGFRIPILDADPMLTSRPQPALPTDLAWPVFNIAYASVTLVLLARLAIATFAAWRLRRNAEPFGAAYLCASLRVPVTAGLFAPAMLLPPEARTWSAAKLSAILAHERAHVLRRDPLWRLIGKAACAVSWFHPLAWLAAASLERIAEETADREGADASGDRHEYANVVLDLLRTMTHTHRRVLVTGMLDGRTVGARIDAILTPSPPRRCGPLARIALLALVAAALFPTAMTNHDDPRVVSARRPFNFN
ncbi:MAG TPA: M56 family metallopeptidase [Thermoanaerobaculia bacterium]|nr:M56 family metallopeptidase [Thermoanaerobaculia bacterium]